MKRLVPDSLAAWALFILIGGLIVAEVSTLAVIMQSRSQSSRMLGFFHLADRVSTIGRAISAVDAAQRQGLATALSSPTLTAAIASQPSAASQVGPDDELAELEDILQARLADIGITDVHVERRDTAAAPHGSPATGSDPGAGPVERVLSDIAEDYSGSGAYIASIQLSDGSWLNFSISIARSPRLLSADMIGLGVLMIALVLFASIWSVRRLTAPYGLFAGAAERFGRDLAAPPLPEEGPSEVRTAAHAFNLMQERLRRVVDGRNQLVAAISHDLRTPVTRLKLRAEAIDDAEQRRHILADLDEIETMTSSVLAFASDSARPEARVSIDLVSLVESLCDETAGADFEPAPDLPPRIACFAQPVALRRCIGNLIANAVKYGHSARVSIVPGAGSVRIRIEDSGPGIPDRDMETVFRPFHRLETSRNRDTGGTGLGLTIARSVARAHGGDVVLSNRPEGGLRAEVVLPLTPAAAASLAPVAAL